MKMLLTLLILCCSFLHCGTVSSSESFSILCSGERCECPEHTSQKQLLNECSANNCACPQHYPKHLLDKLPAFSKDKHIRLWQFFRKFVDASPIAYHQPDYWKPLEELLDADASFEITEVDINMPHERTGATVLYCATKVGLETLAYKLLDRGANPCKPELTLGNTPLHIAAAQGPPEMVEKFLAYTNNLNPINIQQQTPLHRAVDRRQKEIVGILLGAKAVHCIDDNNHTPRDFAQARGYTAIAALFNAH